MKLMMINCKQDNQQNKIIKCKGKTVWLITSYEYLRSVLIEDGKIKGGITKNKSNRCETDVEMKIRPITKQ